MAASLDSRYVATGGRDGTVVIWSGTSRSQTSLVEIQCQCPIADPGNCQIMSLAFFGTGEYLAGRQRSTLFIWRVTDGSFVHSIKVPSEVHGTMWEDSSNYVTLSALEVASDGLVGLSITTAHVVQPPGVPLHDVSPLIS
ncbi:hypothetical protein C8T65DRAFT_676687, partial [Cerioporus squamosus]